MSLQLPLFPLASDWVAPDLGELPDWKAAKRVGVDIETNDPELKDLGPGVRRGAYIVGVSFAIEDGPSYYLPIKHEGGDNLDPTMVMRYLRDQSRRYRGTIVGTNLNYDLDFLAEAGITFPKIAWQRDVQIADPLIYELHDHYDLDTLGKRWGFLGKDTQLLKLALHDHGIKGNGQMWRLPARYVGPYAIEDASLPLRILRKQERVIQDDGLQGVYDLESRLQPVLLKMMRRGVRIDLDALERVEAWSLQRETEQLEAIFQATGLRLRVGDIWKKPALVVILDRLGVSLPETPTGQPQIDQELLDGLNHPVALNIVAARKANRLRTTFAASIRHHLTGSDRIHCRYNQLRGAEEKGEEKGARFGRMSSEHPNLQQQPKRDEFAALWRSIYIPDEPTQQWFSADYSQQEPRVLTHFAEALDLAQAKVAGDRYRKDPSTDTHQMMAELCGILRTPAKSIYLGLCYGMGGAKLAHKLGLPTEWITLGNGKRIEVAGPEAQRLLDRFDQYAPFVRLLAAKTKAVAENRGYILTLSGRRCHFPKKANGEYDWTHKALNRLIQGSAADQTKRALIEVDAAGLPVQLQVHDELDGGATAKEAEAVARVMEECTPLSVPSRVEVKLGASWGVAK